MDIWKEHCYQSIVAELSERFRRRDGEVMRILHERDAEEVLARAERIRRKFADAVDAFFPACALDASITNRLSLDGYSIENITIQTLPDVRLPINVYIPAAGTAPYPAVVVPMGHWLYGKAIPENQILCANLAMQGFLAATYDPICQGERMLVEAEKHAAYFGDAPEDLYSVGMHMIPGNLFYILGKNLISLFVHDGKRVMDYICARTDVDSSRIGMTGQSGGGTQTTYLAALDDRVRAYSPMQCLSKQALMMPQSGIGDCEQSLLGISADEGIDYADILWAALPKPVMVNAGSKDYFTIEGVRQLEAEMSLVYELLGRKGDFTVRVADCAHEIGRETRGFAYDWFGRVLRGDDSPKNEREIAVQSREALACLPGGSRGGTPLAAAKYLLEREREKRPAALTERRDALIALLNVRRRRTTIEQICEGNWLLHVEGARSISFSDTGTQLPVCIVVSEDAALCDLLKSKYRILHAAPWGIESAYRKTNKAYDAETRLFNASAVAGESIMADRVNQLCALAEYACSTGDMERVLLVGQGAGAFMALLAAAVDERFEKAAIIEYIASMDELFEHEEYLFAETLILPGLTAVSDIGGLFEICGGRALGIHPVSARLGMPREKKTNESTVLFEDANAVFSFFKEGRA